MISKVFINIIKNTLIYQLNFCSVVFIFLKRNSSLVDHQEQEDFSTILWILMVEPHKWNILPDCVGVSISSDWHLICSFFKPLMYLLGLTSLSRRHRLRLAQTSSIYKKMCRNQIREIKWWLTQTETEIKVFYFPNNSVLRHESIQHNLVKV